MPETDFLSSPAVSLLIGAFGALILISLLRKARKLFFVSVTGLTLTIGLFILEASAYS